MLHDAEDRFMIRDHPILGENPFDYTSLAKTLFVALLTFRDTFIERKILIRSNSLFQPCIV